LAERANLNWLSTETASLAEAFFYLRVRREGPRGCGMLNRTVLRPIERRDVAALLDIIRDARAQFGLQGRVESLLEAADYALFDSYQKRRTIYYVALIDDEVVGGAGIAPLPGDDPLTCELQRMYLKPDARGQGVGTLLLDACLDAARRFWFVRCYAETVSEMRGALRLYSKNGFENLPTAMGRTQHSHTDRWMVRALKAPPERL
jgi:putative acetyltransferase